MSDEILRVYNDPALRNQHVEEYCYYPTEWISPYIDRRRKVSWDLHTLLKFTRENKAGMHAQHGRNFLFFDTPAGLIFTIDRVTEKGSWLDYGMFCRTSCSQRVRVDWIRAPRPLLRNITEYQSGASIAVK